MVAECYNDWPTGLYDSVTIHWTNWWCSTSNDRYIKIYAPGGQRHDGRVYRDDGSFSGFAIVAKNNNSSAIAVVGNGTATNSIKVELEGLIIAGRGNASENRSGLYLSQSRVKVDRCLIWRTNYGVNTYGMNDFRIVNSAVIGTTSNAGLSVYGNVWVYNVTVANGAGRGVFIYYSTSAKLRNVLSSGNAGGDIVAYDKSVIPSIRNCATSDGSGTNWWNALTGNGSGCRAYQVFRFRDAMNGDVRLRADDTGARDWGMNLSRDDVEPVVFDVEGELRGDGYYDIGMDEVSGVMDSDGDGIPDDIDEDDDNDGMPDWYERAQGFNPHYALDGMEDADGDGMRNYEEYIAGTDPWYAGDVFAIEKIERGVEADKMVIEFRTVTGRVYSVEGRYDLVNPTNVWTVLTNNVPGTGARVRVDVPAGGYRFYRGAVRKEN
jgi:hypothetical protein